MPYEPPFERNDRIDFLCMDIAELVGMVPSNAPLAASPVLHRELRIKTIHSSLLIEGNALGPEAVTAILDGKRVLGDSHDIREVVNAKRAYDLIPELDPYSLEDLIAFFLIYILLKLYPNELLLNFVIGNTSAIRPRGDGRPVRLAENDTYAPAARIVRVPFRIRVLPSLRRRQRQDGPPLACAAALAVAARAGVASRREHDTSAAGGLLRRPREVRRRRVERGLRGVHAGSHSRFARALRKPEARTPDRESSGACLFQGKPEGQRFVALRRARLLEEKRRADCRRAQG